MPFENCSCEGNIFFYPFRDMAVWRSVGISPEGYIEGKCQAHYKTWTVFRKSFHETFKWSDVLNKIPMKIEFTTRISLTSLMSNAIWSINGMTCYVIFLWLSRLVIAAPTRTMFYSYQQPVFVWRKHVKGGYQPKLKTPTWPWGMAIPQWMLTQYFWTVVFVNLSIQWNYSKSQSIMF